MNQKIIQVKEGYESPRIFTPLPSEVEPQWHFHAHVVFVGDIDISTD